MYTGTPVLLLLLPALPKAPGNNTWRQHTDRSPCHLLLLLLLGFADMPGLAVGSDVSSLLRTSLWRGSRAQHTMQHTEQHTEKHQATLLLLLLLLLLGLPTRHIWWKKQVR
jgi:hypothetical protein